MILATYGKMDLIVRLLHRCVPFARAAQQQGKTNVHFESTGTRSWDFRLQHGAKREAYRGPEVVSPVLEANYDGVVTPPASGVHKAESSSEQPAHIMSCIEVHT